MTFSSLGYNIKQGIKNIWRNRTFSLASLITIKSFLNYRRDDAGMFMRLFLLVGFGFLIVLTIIAALTL